MIGSMLILILSAALLFFYFQVICQKILRLQFGREYFRAVAEANRLEFVALRNSLEKFNAIGDYPRLRKELACDFRAVTYLLKHAANVNLSYTNQERLLILYFHWQFLSLAVRCWLKVGEKKAILRLTSILQYFANVVGQRVAMTRFGKLNSADYFLNF